MPIHNSLTSIVKHWPRRDQCSGLGARTGRTFSGLPFSHLLRHLPRHSSQTMHQECHSYTCQCRNVHKDTRCNCVFTNCQKKEHATCTTYQSVSHAEVIGKASFPEETFSVAVSAQTISHIEQVVATISALQFFVWSWF